MLSIEKLKTRLTPEPIPVEIQYWDSHGRYPGWRRWGIYVDRVHAEANLSALRRLNELIRYRIKPE